MTILEHLLSNEVQTRDMGTWLEACMFGGEGWPLREQGRYEPPTSEHTKRHEALRERPEAHSDVWLTPLQHLSNNKRFPIIDANPQRSAPRLLTTRLARIVATCTQCDATELILGSRGARAPLPLWGQIHEGSRARRGGWSRRAAKEAHRLLTTPCGRCSINNLELQPPIRDKTWASASPKSPEFVSRVGGGTRGVRARGACPGCPKFGSVPLKQKLVSPIHIGYPTPKPKM